MTTRPYVSTTDATGDFGPVTHPYIVKAEARGRAAGFAEAIALLLDTDAYANWHGPFELAQPNWRLHFADYLAAHQPPTEATDG
jgi:hypothetical protein